MTLEPRLTLHRSCSTNQLSHIHP